MKHNPPAMDTSPGDLFEPGDSALLALAGATPVTPSPSLFLRIAQATQTEPRFERFADGVASLLDVAREQALTLLRRLDDDAAWEQGFFPGMTLLHAVGGPAVSEAITGFVRLAQGTVFPQHEHLGLERVLVLQGRCRDGDDVFGPGDYVEMAAGSSHSFRVSPGPDLLYLAVVQRGLRVGDTLIGPRDPRG